MDIHPPEHPIRSVRDFLLQIFTVTCGIIIALGLEGIVVDRREAHLARETRINFDAEISENLARVREARAQAAANEAWLQTAVAWCEALAAQKPVKDPADPPPRLFPTLANAAWETAVATQALRLLTFGETRALAAAYTHQATMNDLDTRAREQWISIAAFNIVADARSAAEVRQALQQLRIATAYQYALDTLEGKLTTEYQAAQQEIGKQK
jgi:hypothetical protein